MGGDATRVDYAGDLPQCCESTQLRLPRPDDAVFEVKGKFGHSEAWCAGLEEWHVRIGVSWEGDDEQTLLGTVEQHSRESDPESLLVAHGVSIDEDRYAWVGEVALVVTRLDVPVGRDREVLSDGRDLWMAADAIAEDLGRLATPLAASGDEDFDGWSSAVHEAWPNAFGTDAVILLRSARVTPVLRGHLLGAWACAQAVDLFDHGSTLVAAEAAPLQWRDAHSGIHPDQLSLSPDDSKVWQAEQTRLAKHLHKHLGLAPLPGHPSILTWHTTYRNDAFTSTLDLWR
ncbi:hypothetical protein GCM10009745_63510 [Kribbella yunnanensis]|uniref:Uncharacterized protein n=1 Tax=Kribbella yunnanensis TaxID=190194 RepID=A0ABN2IKP6_9ACTN